MDQIKTYDYIIAGAGCAGLSLLYHILKEPSLCNKSILVIDQNLQKSNDRTWCFWENIPGPFESLVCKRWNHISIHKGDYSKNLATDPFSYKMIEGLDFYNYIIPFAKQFSNVEWKQVKIESIEKDGEKAIVEWNGGTAIGAKIFSSILPIESLYTISQGPLKLPFLWQHFKGHLIQFESDIFDSNVARLMDFNVDQKSATAFMYILPLDKRKALVEYTLFSKSLLKPAQYDLVINDYIKSNYPNLTYQIIHEEIGAIPMTTQVFDKSQTPIYVIGTLGNAVKPSTGYAFKFIQFQVKQIIHSLVQGIDINTEVHNTRHHFYDAVLLYILENQLMEGSEIFKSIFAKNKAATIFKFLSNTSSIWEDIQIMRSLPTSIFLSAAIKVLLRRS